MCLCLPPLIFQSNSYDFTLSLLKLFCGKAGERPRALGQSRTGFTEVLAKGEDSWQILGLADTQLTCAPHQPIRSAEHWQARGLNTAVGVVHLTVNRVTPSQESDFPFLHSVLVHLLPGASETQRVSHSGAQGATLTNVGFPTLARVT